MTNVTYLSDRLDDNSLLTPEQALDLLADEIRAGRLVAQRLVVVALDNREGGYDVRLRSAGGITCSEGIALLHIAQGLLREQMGF